MVNVKWANLVFENVNKAFTHDVEKWPNLF